MSIFSKVLVIFNILGVIGLVVAAGLTNAKRRTWEYWAFRYELVVTGLPLTDKDVDKNEFPISEKIAGEQTRKDLFPTNPVTTQVEEVQRVRDILEGKLKEVEQDKRKQLARYAVILTPLARNLEERKRLVALRTVIDTPGLDIKAPLLDSLKPALENLLNQPPAPANKPGRSFASVYSEALRNIAVYKTQVAAQKPNTRFAGPMTMTGVGTPFVDAFLARLIPDQDRFRKAFATLDQEARKNRVDPASPLTALDNAVTKLVQEAYGQAKPLNKIVDEAFDGAIEDLRKSLETRFHEEFEKALKGKDVVKSEGQPKDIDPLQAADHRRMIARLLFAMVDVQKKLDGEKEPVPPEVPPSVFDDPGYKRFLTIVGLAQGSAAIAGQAQVLHTIAIDLRSDIDYERKKFAQHEADLVLGILNESQEITRMERDLTYVTREADERAQVVARRQTDVKLYQEVLDESRKETAERLRELRDMSEKLLEIRIQIRDATELNAKYEQQLRKMEPKVR